MAREAITTAATFGALDFLRRLREETSERSDEETEAGLILSLLSWLPFLLPSNMSTWWATFLSLEWWPMMVARHSPPSSPTGQYSCSGTLPAGVEGETLIAPTLEAPPAAPTTVLAPPEALPRDQRSIATLTQFAERSCNRKDELGAW